MMFSETLNFRLFYAAASMVVAIMSLAPAAKAQGSSLQKIAVVVGLVPDNISPPTVELYRRVAARLGERGTWTLANDADVHANLPMDHRLRELGSIAAVDRRHIIKAIGPKGTRPTSMIRPLQSMIDTLALDGAVLVDCRERDGGKLSRCGIYYYDRAAGRIVAASAKEFRVPIADATRWAPVLVDQLIAGIEGHRTAKAHAAMEAMVRSNDGDEPQSRFMMELGLGGVGLRHTTAATGSLPLVSFAVGTLGETFSAAIYGELGAASGKSGSVTEEIEERGVGLTFGARSRALETIYWDLGMSAGMVQRKATREGPTEQLGFQDARAFRLRLSPGLLWEFGESVQVGPSLHWVRDISLKSTTEGVYAQERLSTSAIGIGLRLRTVL